jgi:hypothetical protein
MSTKVLDHDATTRLVTALTYLGAGEDAIADLQRRIDSLNLDDRIVVGEIETGEDGRPICEVSFNCDSYAPPVDGEPDPQAIKDLNGLLEGINLDACVEWKQIALSTLTRA